MRSSKQELEINLLSIAKASSEFLYNFVVILVQPVKVEVNITQNYPSEADFFDLIAESQKKEGIVET